MKRNNRNGRVTILLSVLTGTLLILVILLFLFFAKRDKGQDTEENTEHWEIMESQSQESEETQTTEESVPEQESEDIPDLGSDLVFAGKDKWLFYQSTVDGDTMADFYGTNAFSVAEMKEIAENLLKQRDKIEAAGSKFVLLIVPNKESVYFEYLPDEIREKKAKSSRTDDLVGYLQANTDLDIIYMKDKYLSMKDETRIYYKTDTHWNMVGCYVALQEVLRNLYGTYTDVSEVTFQEHLHDFAGDLATMADVGVAYGIDTVYFLGEDQARDEQKVEDSLLLVGDSFAEFLLLESPYYFKGGVINGDIVPYDYNFVKATAANLSRKPDVVLWECCERHIDRLGWDEVKK